MLRKARIAVFVSGGGTNLQAIIDKVASGELPQVELVKVISSKEGAFALERAAKAGIATAVAKEQADVLKELTECGAELIVLAGYMKVLSEEVIKNPINDIYLVGDGSPASPLDFGFEIVNGVPTSYEKVYSKVKT